MKERASSALPVLALIFLLGVLLRVGYTAVTPLDQRGHDTYAHTDYIHYIVDNGRMPPAQEGWEYHQPPLYYFLMAAWSAPMIKAEFTWDQVHRQLQWISTLIAIAVLAVGFLIGKELFPKPAERLLLSVYTFLLATFPGFLYFASRVSNDAPYLLLLFLIFLFFIKWWEEGERWQWYVLSALIGLGLLIKVSIVVFIPITLLCLLMKEKWKVKRTTVRRGIELIAIVLILSGWLVVLRLLEADTARFLSMGNVENHLDPRVVLQNHFFNFFHFNPLRMLEIPYNSAYIDEGGRQYYWEYFFKSFYLGEWDFGPLYLTAVRSMLLFAMSIVPLSLYGIYAEWKAKSRVLLPLLITMMFFQVASITYRIRHTCACNQDYRFAPILIVPVFYFAIRGARALPASCRSIGLAILGLSGVFCVQLFAQIVLGF